MADERIVTINNASPEHALLLVAAMCQRGHLGNNFDAAYNFAGFLDENALVPPPGTSQKIINSIASATGAGEYLKTSHGATPLQNAVEASAPDSTISVAFKGKPTTEIT